MTRYGGPESLELVELPTPTPASGEIRIRVRAAAVNPVDTVFRTGAAPPFDDRPPPFVPGMDLAGEIDMVGSGVHRSVGERVMAVAFPRERHGGAYAEQVVVPIDQVAAAPAGWSLKEASTLPMNGLTARLALHRLDLAPGETIAVTGAAGAVGGFVIQLAKYAGLTVVADAGPSDVDLVRDLGADVVVARSPAVGERFLEEVAAGVAGLVDCAVIGAPVMVAVRDGGRIAAVRQFDGVAVRGITVHQIRVTDHTSASSELDGLRRLAEAGVVTARVAFTVPLDQAGEAHRRLEAGGVRGRIVLTL